MKYTLLFLLYLFIVFFQLPGNAFAYISTVNGDLGLNDYIFQVNLFNPDDKTNSQQVKADSKLWVSITAYERNGDTAGAKVDSFFAGQDYYLGITDPKGKDCYLLSGSQSGNTISRGKKMNHDSTNTNNDVWLEIANLSGQIKLDSYLNCDLTAGSWQISLWRYNANPTEADYIIRSFPFTVQAKDGGTPTYIEPIDSSPISKTICNDRVTKVRLVNGVKGQDYTFWWDKAITSTAAVVQPTENNAVMVVNLSGNGLEPNNLTPKLCFQEGNLWPGLSGVSCSSKAGQYLQFDQPKASLICSATQEKNCTIEGVDAGQNNLYKIYITANNVKPGTNLTATLLPINKSIPSTSGSGSNFVFDFGANPAGAYSYKVTDSSGVEFCSGDKEISAATVTSATEPATPLPKCNTTDPKDPNFCASGAGQTCGAKGVMTAIGCVPTEPQLFVAGLMKYVLGFGGGVALLLMIFGSFQMVTSAGNPDSIKKGREQFTNAIIGLLFIIFSTLFMQILGVDILGLPGFS